LEKTFNKHLIQHSFLRSSNILARLQEAELNEMINRKHMIPQSVWIPPWLKHDDVIYVQMSAVRTEVETCTTELSRP